MGKLRTARNQQRLVDNMDRLQQGKPASYGSLVAFAKRLDEAEFVESDGYEDACIALAYLAPAQITEDTDADLFIDLVSHAMTSAPVFLTQCMPCTSA